MQPINLSYAVQNSAVPIMDYGYILYSGILWKELVKLQKLHYSACHIILRRRYLESTEAMHQELHLDRLDTCRIKHIFYPPSHQTHPN